MNKDKFSVRERIAYHRLWDTIKLTSGSLIQHESIEKAIQEFYDAAAEPDLLV